MYQAAADPWGFEERWYEQRKYAVSLALLPAVRYRSAFEPGCSIGVLTRMLAGRCEAVLSCDVAAPAVRAAARRTGDLPHVQVERREIPGGIAGQAASTSSCSPRSCTTSGITTWSRS